MTILYLIIVAVALTILLRSSKYFLNLAIRGKSQNRYFLRIFPWFELTVWSAFLLWALFSLFTFLDYSGIFFIVVLVILFGLFAWYVLRDFIAGTVLRSDQVLEKGTYISTPSLSGTIRSLGYLSVEIVLKDGGIVRVPYTRLANENITKQSSDTFGRRSTIKLTVPQKLGARKTEKVLRSKILQLPWILAVPDIETTIESHDDHFEITVHFHTLQEDMSTQTTEILRNHIDDQLSGKD